jgi:hypothetical protein
MAMILSVLFVAYPMVSGIPASVITWDVFGYYLYLPLTFIYNDLNLDNPQVVYDLIEQYGNTDTFYQAYQLDNGNWVMKYPMGMALFYLPFFLLGHIVALGTDYPVDGLSAPYQYSMILGSLFYTIAGIWMLRKILLHFFGDKHAAFLMLFICIGTNYLVMNGEGFGTTGVVLFAGVCFLIIQTIQWHREATFWRSITIGVILGLMTIARPTSAVYVLIPLLWGVDSGKAMVNKLKLLFTKQPKHTLWILAGGLLMLLPQMLYWYVYTGEWIFMSYNNPGEGLDLTSPHTVNFLFSFRKGWYIYTPVMVLATVGFAAMYKYRRDFFWPLFTFFLLNLYLVSSWTTWWYAFSYSQRAMLESYPVMAISLGYGIRYARRNGAFFRHSVLVLCFLFTALNLFQTWQYKNGIIHGERMTKEYYFKVFLRTEIPAGAEKYLMVERSSTGEEDFTNIDDYEPGVEVWNEWEQVIPKEHQTVVDNKTVLMLRPEVEFSPTFESTFAKLSTKDHVWIEVEASVFVPDSADAAAVNMVFLFLHQNKPYQYRAIPVAREYDAKAKGWQTLKFHYLTPEVHDIQDVFKAYFWNQGKTNMYIANVVLRTYTRKW